MGALRIERDGPVAQLVLDRPKKLNAMGPDFWAEFVPAVQSLDADETVRAVVIRAEGRAFTAGLDLMAMVPKLPIQPGKGPDGGRQARFHQMIRDMQACMTAVERCRVPVIAAVHGPCIGGGVDLITACDVRFAATDATFSVRETKIAIVADLGTLQRLPRIVGPGVAREWVFTGRDVDAAEAERMGLVNRVLPDAEACVAHAMAVAHEIAANPPLTVQGAKHIMNEATRYETDRLLELVATWNVGHLVTQDLGVAVTAFMTKQPPEYAGR